MAITDEIPDSYIDAIIKANQTGTPNPNKTSGAGMRELIKTLRDHIGETAAASETTAGVVELATLAEALAGTDDSRALTALKSLAMILEEKKKVNYQLAPVALTEVSVLMLHAGQVLSAAIAGASGLKLKLGTGGSYPAGAQTYPFSYAAGDRVFVTFSYDTPSAPSCNVILTCKDS
jgi:hypothetical protein